MDDPSMNHVLGASEFSEDGLREMDASAAAKPSVFGRYTWQTYIRCLFLLAILGVIVAMSWRPGLLRLSLLMSMVSPSRGDSLAWQPQEDSAPRLPQRRQTPPPSEWRLAAGHGASWTAPAPSSENIPHWQGGSLPSSDWKRVSVNPWSWQDDSEYGRRRQPDALAQPSQKSATGFRADDYDGWGTVQLVREPEETPTEEPAQPATALSDLPPLPALSVPAPGQPAARPALELPPLTMPEIPARRSEQPAATESPAATGVISLEPLSLDALDSAPSRPIAAPPSRPAPTERPTPSPNAVTAPSSSEPENVDWKNREITDRIPGAFLTIYPRLKFVGLCVPGQGYIRKYNQIGVPRDLVTQPKLAADDGRIPYGKYYVAGRSRDGDGAKLLLSWPSPDDVRRLGVSSDVVTAVEMAWLDRILPPQTTMAGGGLSLTGLRQWVESTEGGFALEEPHIEEIYTALPEGAWVFIQDGN